MTQSTVLKKGSRGAEVKSVQQKLNSLGYPAGVADGIFGTNTETALSRFQMDNFVSGTLDEQTRKTLQKAVQKTELTFQLPEIKKVHSPNQSDRGGEKISLIVLHYTASGTLKQTLNWFENPSANASAHYVVGPNGEIVQMVNDSKKAWHAGRSEWNGKSGCNAFSIGIEIVNWGILKKVGQEFFTWPGGWTQKYTGQAPIKKGGKYWAPYRDKQMQAVTALCQSLCKKYQLTADQIVGHSDVSPYRKEDPGLHFDWDMVRAAV